MSDQVKEHDRLRDAVFDRIAELRKWDLITGQAVMEITSCFDDMPDDWDDECGCKECRSNGD